MPKIEVDVVGNVESLGRELKRGASDLDQFAARAGKGSKFSASGASAGEGFVGGIKSKLGGAGDVFKGVLGANAVSAGLGAAMAGVRQFGDLLGDSVDEARESQKVGATTAQIIKATGGAAKVSADQVGALATSISNKTGIDDEAIQKGSNLLLTFKNVRNEAGKGSDVFDRATQAATDLSAAGFGSIEGSSKMLGKALNDPIKGISALGRAGVTFTDQQKEQIKTLVESGDVLGAQKIIMSEVEGQVGGVAAASSTAGEKFETMANNLKEQFGTALLPYMDKFLTFMTDKVGPGMSKALEHVGPILSGIASAVGPILSTVGGLVTKIASGLSQGLGSGGGASAFIAQLKPLGTALAGIAGQVAPVLATVGRVVASLLPVIAGVLGAVIGVVQKVAPIVLSVFSAIATAIQQNMPAIMSAVTSIQSALSSIGSIIVSVWSKIGPIVLPIVTSVFGTLVKVISGALKIIAGVFKVISSVLKGDWSGAWQGIKQIASGVIKIVVALVKGMASILGTIWKGIKSVAVSIWGGIKSAASSAWSGIVGVVKDKTSSLLSTVKSIPGKVVSALGNLGSLLLSAGRKLIDGLAQGIRDRISSAVDAVRSGVQRIKNLLPGSPIKEGPLKSWNNGGAGKRLMAMLQTGIESGTPGVRSSLSGALKAGASVRVRTSASAGVAAAGVGGSRVYQVTVQVAPGGNLVEAGRQMVRAIDAFESAGGRRKAT